MCAILMFRTRLRSGGWKPHRVISPCARRINTYKVCVVAGIIFYFFLYPLWWGQFGPRHTENSCLMSRCAVRPWVLCSGAVKPTAHYVRVLYHSSTCTITAELDTKYCMYLRRRARGYFWVRFLYRYVTFVRTRCTPFPVAASSP